MIRVNLSTYILVGVIAAIVVAVVSLEHALGIGAWGAVGIFVGIVVVIVVALILAVRAMLVRDRRKRLHAVAAATGGQLISADAQLIEALRHGAALKIGMPMVRIPAAPGDVDVFVFNPSLPEHEMWAAILPIPAGVELSPGADSTKEHFPFEAGSLAKGLGSDLVGPELPGLLTAAMVELIRVRRRSVWLRFHAHEKGEPVRQLHATRATAQALASTITAQYRR